MFGSLLRRTELELPPWAARLTRKLSPRSASRRLWWSAWLLWLGGCALGALLDSVLVALPGAVGMLYLVELSARVRCRCGLPVSGRYQLVTPRFCRSCGHDLGQRPGGTAAYR